MDLSRPPIYVGPHLDLDRADPGHTLPVDCGTTEILVRWVDKINPWHFDDWKCTKRGDVITVQPGNFPWGRRELSNSDWRIIRLVGLPYMSLAHLTDTIPGRDGSTIQVRRLRLNLDDPIASNTLHTNHFISVDGADVAHWVSLIKNKPTRSPLVVIGE